MSVRTSVAAALVALAFAGQAQAIELGVQDDGRLRHDPAAVFESGHDLGARWVRMIAYVGEAGVPDRIRASHAQGFQVLLTVGGTGTRTQKPARTSLLKYLKTLPSVERLTVVNEVDLSGMRPCTYRRLWMAVRRVYGSRLLFGDYSPWRPVGYTRDVARCGALPVRLDVALHPYQTSDPLAPSTGAGWHEGGIGNLHRLTRAFRRLGIRPRLWLDEFGYPASMPDETAAAMWPRVIRQATRHRARVLISYQAAGPTWNTRPGPRAWCVLAKRCAAPTLDALPLSGGGEVPAYGAY